MNRFTAAVAVAGLFSSGTAHASMIPAPCEAHTLAPAARAARLLVACQDGGFALLDEDTGHVIRAWSAAELPTGAGLSNIVAVSDDGAIVAIGYRSGRVVILGAADAAARGSLQVDFYANTLRFSPDARALWVDHRRFVLGETRPDAALPVDFDTINDLAYSPDGRRVAVANADTMIRILSADHLNIIAEYHDLMVEPMAIAYLTDRSILVGTADGRVLELDASTLAPTHTFRTPPDTYVTRILPVTPGRFLVIHQPASGGKEAISTIGVADGRVVPWLDRAQAIAIRHGRPAAYVIEGANIRRITER